jgi:hypothetical protein
MWQDMRVANTGLRVKPAAQPVYWGFPCAIRCITMRQNFYHYAAFAASRCSKISITMQRLPHHDALVLSPKVCKSFRYEVQSYT